MGIQLLRFIEAKARISHRSEEAQTEDSWRKFITAVVIGHGDWSVVEHVTVTAMIRIDRGITHELVRHRLFGFTQESTRFVNYTKPSFYAEYIPSIEVKPEDRYEWINDIDVADGIYRKWLSRGYSPQVARNHLPNALAATIAITGNLRNWRLFLLMRTSKETHPDCKRITIPMLEEFKRTVPVLYDDIEPNARQVSNLGKAR
jgi:thymidylate synthase (FAD)